MDYLAEALESERKVHNEYVALLIDKIKSLEAAAPKWISVKDELPPVGERVLACAGGRVVYEALIDCDDSWFKAQNHSGFVFDITHWMKLPEPPRRKSND